MLRKVLVLGAVAAASAFAPGSVLPTTSRGASSNGITMQRIGSSRPAGQGSAGGQGSAVPQRQGSMGRQGSAAPQRQGSAPPARQGSVGTQPRQGSMFGGRPAPAPTPVRATAGGSGRFSVTAEEGNAWDIEGADWAVNGGIFGKIGDVTWAREAEVKHGRICMLAATGAIVQDLYTFPFMDKWYKGEKMWGLHEAAIKSGAMWQVLFFVGLLEIPFMLNLANGSCDGTGDLGFDPLGLKEDGFERKKLVEVKNGRLAMIAISGMTHHYFLTGKGPIEFITQIPNFKSCAAAAVTTGLCK